MPDSLFRITIAAGCLLFCGCGGGEVVQSPEPLMLVISGDTAGRIVPCGCTSNQSGGLLRRGTYLAKLRETGAVIYLEVGGAGGGISRYDREKFEAILKGEVLMQIAAHNIGENEALLGPEYLRKIGTSLGVPFVSANGRDSSGHLVAEALRIIETGGRRIAVVGVLSPRYATKDLNIDPPDQAVLSALAKIKEPADAIVVLAYLPEEELLDLASRLPEVDLVVGGPTGQNIPPRKIGQVLVASATNQGKFVAEFHLPGGKENTDWQGRLIEMTGDYADDPGQKKNLKTFYDRLAELDLTPADTSYDSPLPDRVPAGFSIAGTKACRDCHTEPCEIWDRSRHASAWSSLAHTGAQVDADCQRCHTTGFGLPGGFLSTMKSLDRQNVGCESCHGPSLAHANDPQMPTAHFKHAANHCLKCHDAENSPEFVYKVYWPQIEHGE